MAWPSAFAAGTLPPESDPRSVHPHAVVPLLRALVDAHPRSPAGEATVALLISDHSELVDRLVGLGLSVRSKKK